MKRLRKAVIPAAGWGTRCLPASKSVPKEMFPVVDKPAIQYVVEEAAASGITDILVVTGRNKESIEDYFDRHLELEKMLEAKAEWKLLQKVREPAELVRISFIRQKEQRGLGHAVLCAREFAGSEPFAVLLPDDLIISGVPCLKQMADIYRKHPGTMLAVTEVSPGEVNRYGIIEAGPERNKLFEVRDLVEKPDVGKAPSNLGIVGRYILEPEIFSCLQKIKPGVGREVQLTDALKAMLNHTRIYAYRFSGLRFDVGDTPGLIEANLRLGLVHPLFGKEIRRRLLAQLPSGLQGE